MASVLLQLINTKVIVMKHLTSWQKETVNAIAHGLLEYEAQQLCLDINFDKAQAKTWISRNKYPFGRRENHPYKVWLSEIKLVGLFLETGIGIRHYSMWRDNYKKPRKPNNWNETRKNSYDPNQLSLF